MTFGFAGRLTAFLITTISAILLGLYGLGVVLPLMYPPPWSCVGFAAAGLSIWLGTARRRGSDTAQQALSIFVLLIGIISWGEYLSGRDFGMDTLLFPDELLTTVPHPGRPAPVTGFNFALLGLALFLLRYSRGLPALIRELSAVTSIAFCHLAMLAFVFATGRGPASREIMVPLTALFFIASSVTLLASRPEGPLLSLLRSAGPAGIFARWLMPVPLILPIVTVLVRMAGQKTGVLDARNSGPILSFVDVLAAILIVWGSSTQVLRSDILRRDAEEELRRSRDELDERVQQRTLELRRSNQKLAAEVAERHRAERDLQLANATLNNVIDASPLAICALNQDGSVRKRNSAAELLRIAWAEEFREIIERAALGETSAAVEIIQERGKGLPRYLNVWASPLVRSGGERDGVLVMAVDVSERKAFELQIRQTQKLESLGVLAGGIAHDFNNLLTGIMGNASLVFEEMSSTDPQRNYLRQVISASQRASDLTRQLLAYAGKGRFVIERVNISQLVTEISSLIRTSISRNVQLQLALDPDIPAIEADASQIQQVVMNLVINGSEAIPEKGRVIVSTGLEDLNEAAIRSFSQSEKALPGRYVSLEVQDNGSGMDEETISRIFDPFFTTKFTGRGLGLAAVQGVVRSHKGLLGVRSAPGQGTTFRLLFPVAGATGASIPASRPAREVAGSRGASLARQGTVLVIDDEAMVRETARNTLERIGYSVIEAEDGEAGIGQFAKQAGKITAVLLDFTMPGLSGLETFQRLKQIRPDVPVILSSGFNETEVARMFNGEGIAGFIQKPYTIDALASKLKQALAGSRSARA
jgi:signal transduction histidine kinase/ActR/RegA family two-component response regulator